MVPCQTGRWITPIVMTIYLLVANILLINLLIASFNTIYNSVNARSMQFWNFQRFSIVLEYEEKPVLPAPFTGTRICQKFIVWKFQNFAITQILRKSILVILQAQNLPF